MSMKSEITESTKEVLNKIGRIPYFIDLKYIQDAPNNKTSINVTLTKFVLSFNFSTHTRLMKFMDKIYKYQNDTLYVVNLQKEKEKNLTIKDKLKIIESKKDEVIRKGVKKDFMGKLNETVKKRKENENNLNNEDDIRLNTSFNKKAKSVYSKRTKILEDNMNNYTKEVIKTEMKISFEMKQIELIIPLDAENDKTKAILFNFNTMIKLKQENECENYYDNNKKLVLCNYLQKNLFINAMVFNIDFDMYSIQDDQLIFNLLNDKILSNSRITLFVKSFIIPEKNSEIMTVDIKIEPITMLIGFRQIRIIKDFLEIMNKSLYPPKEIEEKEFYFDEKNENEILVKNSINKKIEYDNNKKLKRELEMIEEEEKKQEMKSKIGDELTKKIYRLDKKIDEQIKYNVTTFNKLMDVNFILEKATIKLVDNTGDYEKPLTMIDMSKISMKMITNTNPYDVDNMAQAIVEMISDKKPENLNICNLYMYLDSYFSIEMNYFNERVSDWEPILEPWSGNFKIEQIDKITRQKLQFKSDYMMNFNLSVQSVDVLNTIMKKINQNEANWKKKEKNKKDLMITDTEIIDKNANNNHRKKEISLIVENKSGIDLDFNFLANKEKSYNIKNYHFKSFSKNELSSIYQNLNDEIVMKKKDKLEFKFEKIDYSIDELDFSYNHFVILKIPMNSEELKNTKSLNMDKLEEKNKTLKKSKTTIVSNSKGKDGKLYELLENEENEEKNFFEICVKIKNNGLVKVITIESNISFFNNTSFAVNLLFFSLKKKYLADIYVNDSLDVSQAVAKLKCDHHSEIRIPLNLLLEPHTVFLSTILESGEGESFRFLFDEMSTVYSIGYKYNKLMSNYSASENEEKKKEAIERLTRENSQQIKFEKEKKNIVMTLDYLLLKAKNHIVTSIEDESDNKNKSKGEMFYYQMILNPPIIIENKIPFDLSLNFSYLNEKENNPEKIKQENQDFDMFERSIFVSPLDKIKIYNFDTNENKVNCVFNLNYKNDNKYSSNEISTNTLNKNKNYLDIYLDGDKNDYFEMNIEKIQLNPNKYFDYNYLTQENFITQCEVFIFYFEFILVNRIEEELIIKPNNLKDVSDYELENILNCYKLSPKSINIFSTPRDNTKAKIKIRNSDWSEKIEMAAQGLQSANSVLFPPDKNSENKINFEFATVITSSNNFNYSSVLIIEPRFVMVNKTGIDLKFRQVDNKNNPAKDNQIILNDSEKVLNFFKNQNFKGGKNLQFFINSGSFNEEEKSPELWSQNINIEDLQEHNISLFIPKNFNFSEDSKIPDGENNKNIYSYDDEVKYYLVRVIIQTLDNGLIYIILNEPKFPQFMLKNSTRENVKISQGGQNDFKNILPGKIIPYTFKNFEASSSDKTVEIEILNKKVKLNLDTIEEAHNIKLDKKNDLKHSNSFNPDNTENLNIDQQEKLESLIEPQIFVFITTDHKNDTRIINISTNFDEVEGLLEAKQNIISKKIKSSSVNFKFNLKGIGLSFIDSQPKEVFYISFYSLKIILRNFVTRDKYVISKFANYVIYLKNFQVDYCLEGSFKQIIYPKVQYIPFKEDEIDKEEYVEFVKILLTKANSSNIQNDSETEKIAQFEFLLQEMNVKIDQSVINVLLDLINQFVNRLDFYIEEKKENCSENGNESDSQDNLSFEEDNIDLDNNTISRKFTGGMIKEDEFKLIKTKSFNKNSSGLIRVGTNYAGSKKGSANSADKNNLEIIMSPNYPSFEEVVKISDESDIYNIAALALSGIKINLTLRIDISTLEISLVPAFVTRLLGTFGNALARITDSPLSFNELRITNVYNKMSYVTEFITSKYRNQGIMQIYKIIGSSDLIGNPVNLVGKIGTGFIEFFNEPRKGFVNGPIQFGTGVAKGVNSLVSNVVGGSLDTVGKITSTLYTASKNIQGEKGEINNEEEPTNLVSGAYEGIKGGFMEIAYGVTGIFVNPYKSAKKEGVKGFFKGVGKGILGAVISPFSAVLKAGNSVAVGMKNTATYFTRAKLKTDRFRHPRHINQSQALKPFDNELAETQAIIANLLKKANAKVLNTYPKIIFTKDFDYNQDNYLEKTSSVIITDYYLLVVYDGQKKIVDAILKNIKKTEVHRGQKNKDFVLLIYLKDGKNKFIPCKDLQILCQIHSILEKLI